MSAPSGASRYRGSYENPLDEPLGGRKGRKTRFPWFIVVVICIQVAIGAAIIGTEYFPFHQGATVYLVPYGLGFEGCSNVTLPTWATQVTLTVSTPRDVLPIAYQVGATASNPNTTTTWSIYGTTWSPTLTLTITEPPRPFTVCIASYWEGNVSLDFAYPF